MTRMAAVGFISNPQDLVRWAKLLYEEKVPAKPSLEDLLTSGFRGESAERIYSLGVGISEAEFGLSYGHGGWFPGYRTSYYTRRQGNLISIAG